MADTTVGAAQPAPKPSLRGTVIACAVCLAFDGVFAGAPSIGFVVCLMALPIQLLRAAVAAFSDRRRALWRVKSAAVYVATAVLIGGIFVLNSQVGRRNAERVIAAVEAYRLASGSYPAQLADLVPTHLPELPVCAYRLLMPCNYVYLRRAGAHSLLWVEAPPFGRRSYEFETRSWSYVD